MLKCNQMLQILCLSTHTVKNTLKAIENGQINTYTVFMGTFCRTEESLIICLPLLVLDVITQHSSFAVLLQTGAAD